MNKLASPSRVVLLARDMVVGYFPTTITDILGAGDIVRKNKLSKLIIELRSSSTITESVCSSISQAYKLCHERGKHVDVRIDVKSLKTGKSSMCNLPVDVFFVTEGSNFYVHSQNVVTIPSTGTKIVIPGSPVQQFGNVVLGGTFDRLHAGHKILLTEAVLRCQKRLTVGVTDASMIKNKTLWELIEPVETRIKNVLDFLQDVDDTLKYNVVPISDMYGPTRYDPDFEMIVVSAETARGGQKVNEARNGNHLSELVIHIVPLVEDSAKQMDDEDKISSSNERRRILGTTFRPPQCKPNLPDRPYLIGLTGGIASGKSNIGENLRKKGAGLIDCDKVAHKLYAKGTPTFRAVVDLFGEQIVGPDGEINRRALGAIVFSSKVELEKLNNLLWPAILEASLIEANRLYREESVQVVVLEAAVLLRAGWDKAVHQVWTSIIPMEEAVQRIIKRNNLDEASAQARVNAQPSNCEQVAIANIVFSSLYTYEFTALQVDRAWKILWEYLESQRSVCNKL